MDMMKRNLLKALKEIRESPYVVTSGICFNVDVWVGINHIRVDKDLMVDLFKQWPEYSGDSDYPVPGVEGMSAEETYENAFYLWEGEYGELRMRLLNFMIDTLDGAY